MTIEESIAVMMDCGQRFESTEVAIPALRALASAEVEEVFEIGQKYKLTKSMISGLKMMTEYCLEVNRFLAEHEMPLTRANLDMLSKRHGSCSEKTAHLAVGATVLLWKVDQLQ